jgi:hypothetical protein
MGGHEVNLETRRAEGSGPPCLERGPPAGRSSATRDDQTAIKVTDAGIEVISEGHWRLFEH